MKFKSIFISFSLLFTFFCNAFAGAVIDVVKPDIAISASNKRDYIPITNIGNTKGTFIVQVKNVTDPKNVITYTNKELKKLPIIISPILFRNLGAGANKRITVRRKGNVEKPIQLQLVISEYKKLDKNGEEVVSDDAAGIDVQGSIHYTANIKLS